MAIITVIGAGMMGSALAFPLRDNGHTVRIAGSPLDGEIIDRLRIDGYHLNLKRTLPGGIEYYDVSEIDRAITGADLILCGVSSFGLDWFIQSIIPILQGGVPVLSVTKGMLDLADGGMTTYPELFRTSTDKSIPFCAVGGPSTSYELADRDYTCVTFCGWDMDVLRRIKAYFASDYYHISLSTDVRGVECAVALKNAYALAVSLAVGMSWAREGREFEHYNSQAALFGQSIFEMQALLRLCGEKDSNIMLAAGDLYVTVFGGRTRKIGTLLGTGLGIEEALETLSGVTLESIVITKRMARAVGVLKARGEIPNDAFPLLCHIGELVEGKTKRDIPWGKFEREVEI
ncbi:MAG: glycerol-3-phosphate dehydrogenase [Oscillospiraceae bacterium]